MKLSELRALLDAVEAYEKTVANPYRNPDPNIDFWIRDDRAPSDLNIPGGLSTAPGEMRRFDHVGYSIPLDWAEGDAR